MKTKAIKTTPDFLSSYKGVFYKYDDIKDTWHLSDGLSVSTLHIYDASKYRIDQCMEDFKKRMKYGK